MHKADPGSTWILSMHVEPMYPVKFRGISCLLSLRSTSFGVKVMDGTCHCTRWHWGHWVRLSLLGTAGTYVRKDSESASASLNTSFISFERQSSSCKVIRAGILANCANMSKQKRVLSPLKESFLKDLSNRTSFCFPLSNDGDGAEAWTGAVVPDIINIMSHWESVHTVTSTVFQTGCLMAER